MSFVIQVLNSTKGFGHWQAESKAASERQEIGPEFNKTDHRVAGEDRELAHQILNIAKEEEEDKKLLEEVDREAMDSNMPTMMMVNEW